MGHLFSIMPAVWGEGEVEGEDGSRTVTTLGQHSGAPSGPLTFSLSPRCSRVRFPYFQKWRLWAGDKSFTAGSDCGTRGSRGKCITILLQDSLDYSAYLCVAKDNKEHGNFRSTPIIFDNGVLHFVLGIKLDVNQKWTHYSYTDAKGH